MLDERLHAEPSSEDSEFYRLELFGEDNLSFPRSHGMIADTGPTRTEDGAIRSDRRDSTSWLIDKNLTHIERGRLAPSSSAASGLFRRLSSSPHRRGSYRFVVDTN